jgi:hypothetical protein
LEKLGELAQLVELVDMISDVLKDHFCHPEHSKRYAYWQDKMLRTAQDDDYLAMHLCIFGLAVP